jgi:indolepyruvate ferredoxin oxidoreductase alpha subunit
MLLLGAEAIAQGALDAGLSGVFAYREPLQPKLLLTFKILLKPQNGKSALTVGSATKKQHTKLALGMSFTGKRTMVCMKQWG